MKILGYHRLDDEMREIIRESAAEHGHTVVFAESKDELVELGKDAEVLFGFCTKEIFAAVPNAKWVQSWSAGVESHLFPAMLESDVVLTNAAGAYAPQAADHAFAMLLALARGLHRAIPMKANREWRRQSRSIFEIGGWTLGVIGMGGFGRNMAKRAKGFDMRVVAVDPYCVEKPDTVDELLPMERLPDLLRRSDVLMTACPLTKDTYHMIDADALSLMKPTAYVINVTRGGIVDEDALADALKNGEIAGAGLDVTEVEPLPEDSPLWELDNIVITGHRAGMSQHRVRRAVELFCDNIGRYTRGEPLRNVVRKELGF